MVRIVAVSIASLLVLGVAQAAGGTVSPLMPPGTHGTALTRLLHEVGGPTASAWQYDYLNKLDSHLQAVAASRLGGGDTALTASSEGVTTDGQGEVSVDVYVNGAIAPAADALRAAGMRVTAVSTREPERLVEGFLPAGALTQAAELASTHAIVATFSGTNTGARLSQGDAAIHGPQARLFGPNGSGVLVGVISDSIKASLSGFNTSVANGDLPANTTTLNDAAGGEDEGRAMAEIIYDEAPGISGILFSTGTSGVAAKVNSINNLVAAGVKVIADDTFQATEPYFQDGVISQAVDRAKAAGVAYFVSAGNRARQSWEGTYADASGSEDFDPSGAVDTVQTVGTIPANSGAYVALQWAEPWGHASDDFAVDVYAISGGTPVFQFTVDTNNLTSGLPSEFVSIGTAGSAVAIGIAIRHTAGTGAPFMKYIAGGSWSPATIEHPTSSGTIDPDAASARGALTVAASQYTTPTSPETFSSRGPATRLFDVNGVPLATADVRQKPELAAPDGVDTDLPGTSGLNPFFGTSAAAPAAAGIATLIRSAKPLMGVDEIYAIMTSTANALDCTATAGQPDADCGAGFVMADRALAMALDGTPPSVTPVLSPAAPDGLNGWYRVPVSVTWSIADGESPVVDPTGCGAASVGDATPITCSATSAGGTTSVPLALKVDTTPPSAPAFAGIAAKTYVRTVLPARAKLACTSADPTSGIAGCTISGYSNAFGAHTLTATATNAAGLTATSTLRYSVAKPPAISQLKLAKVTLAAVASSGVPVTVRIAAASTHLVVKLTARIGTVTVTLGGVTKKVGVGTARLRIKLGAKAKRLLAKLPKATLLLSVRATSAGAKTVSLKSSRIVRRT